MQHRLTSLQVRSFASVLALLLSGCVAPSPDMKPWSPEWNATVGHVDVRPSRTQEKAWQGASGVDVSTANRWAMDSYMWSQGDNVVGLVGGIVTRSIAKGQQSDFEEKNADVLPRLQDAFGTALNRRLDETVRRAFLQTSFKSRLGAPHQSQFYTDIVSCGFHRVGVNATDEVLLTPYIIIKITLVSANPARCYLMRTIHKNAAQTHQHTAREYATNTALTNAAIKAILDQFEFQIAGRLKQRLGE